MPVDIQAKLLRLLQENQYTQLGSGKTIQANCRFIFSTNRDIPKMIKEGEFREDLYYRINVFNIHLPPLKDRKEDIPDLIYHFIKKYGTEFNLSISFIEKDSLDCMTEYPWPGNIRELENIIIRILAALSVNDLRTDKNIIKMEDIPVSILTAVDKDNLKLMQAERQDNSKIGNMEINGNYEMLVSDFSKTILREALKRANGNKTQAAKILGINRVTFYHKIKELDLE